MHMKALVRSVVTLGWSCRPVWGMQTGVRSMIIQSLRNYLLQLGPASRSELERLIAANAYDPEYVAQLQELKDELLALWREQNRRRPFGLTAVKL